MVVDSTSRSVPVCPRCGAAGRAVSDVTVRAHLDAFDADTSVDAPSWALCGSGHCDVVYFAADTDVAATDVVVPVTALAHPPFHKSADPARFVCFCFGHTVASVREAGGEDDGTALLASIAGACRAGAQDCERRNPQGRCCLANVRAVLKLRASESA